MLSLFWLLRRQPRGLPEGLPCQQSPSGSPRIQAVPLLLSATILQHLLVPIQTLALGFMHPQCEALVGGICFKETKADIPDAL